MLQQLQRSIDRGDPRERLTASIEAALSHLERLSGLVQRLRDGTQPPVFGPTSLARLAGQDPAAPRTLRPPSTT